LKKVKKMTGLSNVPDHVIMQGAEMANKHLGKVFAADDAIGAGFFDTIGKVIGGLFGGTDAPIHSRTDGGLGAGGYGAGFWDTLGNVATSVLPMLPMLLADESTNHMMASSSRSAPRGKRYYAAEHSSFPILNIDGSSAGKLDLIISRTPMPMRTYISQQCADGEINIDDRLKSAKTGESQPAFEAAKTWLRSRPQYGRMYVTVKQNLTAPLFGRSWEASLANALAGYDDLVTGKITHVDRAGRAHIGGIVGAGEKKRMGNHLIVPAANATEAPGNPAISAISVK
jgi:hypothetical protein